PRTAVQRPAPVPAAPVPIGPHATAGRRLPQRAGAGPPRLRLPGRRRRAHGGERAESGPATRWTRTAPGPPRPGPRRASERGGSAALRVPPPRTLHGRLGGASRPPDPE